MQTQTRTQTHVHTNSEHTTKICVFHMLKFRVCKKKPYVYVYVYVHKHSHAHTHDFCIKLCQGESYSSSLVFKRAKVHTHMYIVQSEHKAQCNTYSKYEWMNKIHRNENEMYEVVI